MTGPERKLKINIAQSLVLLFAALAIVGTVFCNSAWAQDGQHSGDAMAAAKETIKTASYGQTAPYALIGAAVAFGLGAVGAGFAISHVGAAAMGAVAEKPQIAGQALIFVALAEGIVVFGFITALMILGKV